MHTKQYFCPYDTTAGHFQTEHSVLFAGLVDLFIVFVCRLLTLSNFHAIVYIPRALPSVGDSKTMKFTSDSTCLKSLFWLSRHACIISKLNLKRHFIKLNTWFICYRDLAAKYCCCQSCYVQKKCKTVFFKHKSKLIIM